MEEILTMCVCFHVLAAVRQSSAIQQAIEVTDSFNNSLQLRESRCLSRLQSERRREDWQASERAIDCEENDTILARSEALYKGPGNGPGLTVMPTEKPSMLAVSIRVTTSQVTTHKTQLYTKAEMVLYA